MIDGMPMLCRRLCFSFEALKINKDHHCHDTKEKHHIPGALRDILSHQYKGVEKRMQEGRDDDAQCYKMFAVRMEPRARQKEADNAG